ncbi:hypothetical protein HN51_012860 [Arachis hypogaea]|uniref:Cell wall / vacuolar inhibitor of fructosidase 2 n=2 Tax=Arachis TaxID=3817 RepID=A0A6P4CS70_ARADU|nr:cell wall / vacuolar inhibitor of fructosidase 2 [Arachis duranensis]XP_025689631.1 cell wall / vacuolar inhibitor of fructosidase 2 [Arachis hypogaea]QHO58450.1 Cell wall / vacuolar inhibitor of fructosidase [Arachis hypogaea]
MLTRFSTSHILSLLFYSQQSYHSSQLKLEACWNQHFLDHTHTLVMASSKILYHLLLLFFVLGDTRLYVNGDTKLMKKTCRHTKYYDLCFSSLKSDPTSSNADPRGLAMIMVGVAMANATSTSSYLSSQLHNPATNDTTFKRVLKECLDKYTYAGESLQASVQDLADQVYDYAYMHVSAAKDYPNVCHNLFKQNPALVYPPELARRENALKHICDVAMGIIDDFNWY